MRKWMVRAGLTLGGLLVVGGAASESSLGTDRLLSLGLLIMICTWVAGREPSRRSLGLVPALAVWTVVPTDSLLSWLAFGVVVVLLTLAYADAEWGSPQRAAWDIRDALRRPEKVGAR